MAYEYDILVYIGRFQPLHVGHVATINRALQLAKHVVIIVGSAGCARSPKNPFTSRERVAMLKAQFRESTDRLSFVEQEDHPYNFERWLAEVTAAVYSRAFNEWKADKYNIGIIGLKKDDSSFYLNHFPQWDFISFMSGHLINATDIRRLYFGIEPEVAYEDGFDSLTPTIREWLQTFYNQNSVEYHLIADEWQFILDYRKSWESAPYPPTFVTVDSIVTLAGHILMITRGAKPGYGLLALPGGYVNQGEVLQDAAIRELIEETRIDLPKGVITGAIRGHRIFDDPARSLRGRTITVGYHIALNESYFPKVRGGDDASRARWVPLGQLRRDQCFEDHYDIIETMTGI